MVRTVDDRSWRRARAAAVAGLLLLTGCTSDGAPADDAAPSASPPPTSDAPPATNSPTPSPSPTPEPVDIEFEYERPDPVCPDVSDIERLASTDDGSYTLEDPSLHEEPKLKVFCRYWHSDVEYGEDDTLLEDHFQVTSEVALYRDWSRSRWAGEYPALPLRSADIGTWDVGVLGTRNIDGWWEGCGSGQTPCADDEEPEVRTDARQTIFQGHVGNLEFYVHVTYVSEDPPPDAEERNTEVFRDLVRATVDNYAQAG